jgi:hypothetical protein
MYPQTATGTITPIDYEDDSIFVDGNPYIMRARMTTKAGAAGPWSSVQLPDYMADLMGVSDPWGSTALALQKASLDTGTQSTYYDGTGFNTYVSAVNINLEENPNQAVTGVNVWFRWMPSSLFESTPSNNPPATMQQKVPTASNGQPQEWALAGTYNSSSFTTAIPRKTDVSDTNAYFQILVTDNTTTKPNKYNYRWIGNTSVSPKSKIGEAYTGPTRGYVPWNPWYAASVAGAASAWTTYARQRSTLQDIALFYPRKWRI